jgi:hypothetical protein
MRKLTLFVLVMLPIWVFGQNLVPNPSFEEYTLCPTNMAQIDRAIGWESIQASPDLFNACGLNDTVNVPANFFGYQEAYYGQGYAGIGTAELYTKEALQAELTTALVPGIPTYVSMQVSPGGYGIVGTTSPRLASSGIGIRFSVAPLNLSSFYGQYDFDTAVVWMEQVLNDTASWVSVSGVFVPDSAYRFIQIGNFFSDANTMIEVLNANGDWGGAYAFVDNVCVSLASGECQVAIAVEDLGVPSETLIVTVSNGHLLIKGADTRRAYHGQIVDALGRFITPVLSFPTTGYESIDLQHWRTGVYLLNYWSSAGQRGSVRFVHVQP